MKVNPNQLFSIAEYYNNINDMDILDIHLKALSLRMCELGRTKVDAEIGFTCTNCNWCHICSNINDYLSSANYNNIKGEKL